MLGVDVVVWNFGCSEDIEVKCKYRGIAGPYVSEYDDKNIADEHAEECVVCDHPSPGGQTSKAPIEQSNRDLDDAGGHEEQRFGNAQQLLKSACLQMLHSRSVEMPYR